MPLGDLSARRDHGEKEKYKNAIGGVEHRCHPNPLPMLSKCKSRTRGQNLIWTYLENHISGVVHPEILWRVSWFRQLDGETSLQDEAAPLRRSWRLGSHFHWLVTCDCSQNGLCSVARNENDVFQLALLDRVLSRRFHRHNWNETEQNGEHEIKEIANTNERGGAEMIREIDV